MNEHKVNHSLENFLKNNREEDSNARCALVASRVLRADVDGGVWINAGAAIAHYGDLTFNRIPTVKTKNIKTMALRELVHLVEASGKGQLYCAKAGWHLRTIYLHNETLSISSNELIAFEKSLDFELELIGKGLSIATGGIVEVKISGAGWVAIGVHGDPLVLPVTQDRPLFTDPHATVAWTDGVIPTFSSDLTLRSLLLHGGKEDVQMRFEGEGFVVIQPAEDPARFTGKRLRKLL